MIWFRRLTPLKGWRVFLGEVGIIVLGVLLALAAQQAVEAWQWHKQVAETRSALASEIADNLVNAAERQMADRCLRGRLTNLLQTLETGGDQWKGTHDRLSYTTYVEGYRDFPTVYRAPFPHWTDSVWQIAKADGSLSHMDRDEQIGLSTLYASFDRMRQIQLAEEQLFPSLQYLGFDRSLDATGRRETVATIGRLHWAQQMLVEEADFAFGQVRALGLDLSTTRFRAKLAAREAKQRGFRGDCVQSVVPQVATGAGP